MYHNLVIGAGTETTEAERSKKMKRTIACVFALLMSLLLAFSACTQGANSSPNDNPDSTINSSSSGNSEKPDDKPDEEPDVLDGYEKSCAITEFPSDDLEKVNLKPTFDISDCIYDAEEVIVPYQLFGDGMCLQRDAVNKIWGTIENLEGNEHIAAKFRGKVYYGTVENDNWEIYLPFMTAGGPFELTLICDWGVKTIKDVYVGEVYMLSGQSNMEWKVEWSGEVLADLYASEAECKNDNIRLLSLATKFHEQPTKTLEQPPVWNGANVSSIKNFSAVGYIFGKEMQKKLDCPVGLIVNAIGGTITESWMDEEAYTEYEKICDTACDESLIWKKHSQSFNGVVYPLEGYNIRGVCWYQGESNIYGAEKNHDKALKALVSCFRRFFNNPQLTFSMAELARFVEDPVGYSIINEKITVVAREDKLVCNAINLDQGDWSDIHPKDKRTIATRLASETLRNFFGKDENAAPKVKSCKVVSDKEIQLTMNEKVVLKNGSSGFEVLTAEGYSLKCNVTINDNVITVTSGVPFSGIRYGYNFEKTAENVEDLSRTITVYDEQGLPCDMFMINF